MGSEMSRRPGRVTRLLAATALAVLLAVWSAPASAQLRPGGTLGVDCDLPRAPTGFSAAPPLSAAQDREMCAAYRATALHYNTLLRTVAQRISLAARTLPPPLLHNLIDHLDNGHGIPGTLFDSTGKLKLGLTIGSYYGNDDIPGETKERAKSIESTLRFFEDGLLTGTGIETGHGGGRWDIRVALCVPVRGLDGSGHALVWLHPNDLRDIWTPRMVQRAVASWEGRASWRKNLRPAARRARGVDRAPLITDRSSPGRLVWADGRDRILCQGGESPWDVVVTGPVLARMADIRWRAHRESRVVGCTAQDGSAGFQEERRYDLNGIHVDETGAAINLGGPPPNDGWLSNGSCRSTDAPGTTRVETRLACPPGYPEGTRIRHTVTITFPERYNRAPREIVWVVNRCARPETRTRPETRGRSCPAGWSGGVTEARSVTDTRTVWVPEADRRASPWIEASATPWQATVNTCRQLYSGGGGSRGEPESFDVDGDGRGDYRDRSDARAHGQPGGRTVADGCGRCDGPSGGDDRDRGSGGNDPGGGSGGGWSSGGGSSSGGWSTNDDR